MVLLPQAGNRPASLIVASHSARAWKAVRTQVVNTPRALLSFRNSKDTCTIRQTPEIPIEFLPISRTAEDIPFDASPKRIEWCMTYSVVWKQGRFKPGTDPWRLSDQIKMFTVLQEEFYWGPVSGPITQYAIVCIQHHQYTLLIGGELITI